jgi:hypothetical protein
MIKSVYAQIKNKYLYFSVLIGLGFCGQAQPTLHRHIAIYAVGRRHGDLLVCGIYYVCQRRIGAVDCCFISALPLREEGRCLSGLP